MDGGSLHDEENAAGHFFDPATAPRSVGKSLDSLYGTAEERERRATEKEARSFLGRRKGFELHPMTPANQSDDGPPCIVCDQPKKLGSHRGRGSHTFTTAETQKMVRADNGDIMSAFLRACQSITIGNAKLVIKHISIDSNPPQDSSEIAAKMEILVAVAK